MGKVMRVKVCSSWEIDCDELKRLFDHPTDCTPIYKNLVISKKNVVMNFRFELSKNLPTTTEDQFALKIFYDGPQSKIGKVIVKFEIFQARKTYKVICSEEIPEIASGDFFGVANFDLTQRSTAPPLVYLIELELPYATFDFTMKAPELARDSKTASYFDVVKSGGEAKYSDMRLISLNGSTFHCHRFVFDIESEVWRKQLEPFDNNIRDENEKAGNFYVKFDDECLMQALRYIYVGQIDLSGVPIDTIIDVAQFGHSYMMEDLYKPCIVELWSRVVVKSTTESEIMSVIRLAELFDEKYLKDRATDVLADRWNKDSDASTWLVNAEGKVDSGGMNLMIEFTNFMKDRASTRFSEPI